MQKPSVVSQEQWTAARKQLLEKEKEFTRLRDELSEQRRNLPWVRIDKAYAFDGPGGKQTLADLFAGRRQLIVQHLMFDPSWDAACKSCSFWADEFDAMTVHLAARDVTLVGVSIAPLAKLEAFARRMGWKFKWVSSAGCDFNRDFHVTVTAEDRASGEFYYNYRTIKTIGSEQPGISVFYRDDDGTVYHTYSCYSRGLDMMNATYQYLDLTPKGRDEDGLPFPMHWVRLHDAYAG
jgi:predicted dithiol-disulfide oxidoreductase (DUF899 family)